MKQFKARLLSGTHSCGSLFCSSFHPPSALCRSNTRADLIAKLAAAMCRAFPLWNWLHTLGTRAIQYKYSNK